MSGKVGAYGTTAKTSDTSFRKEWNQEEFTAKAREKDRENQERAVEAEEYARKGKKPPRKKDDTPRPTAMMQARDAPLELDKNLNKVMIVNANAGGGAGQPGFYCDVCKRTSKDSVGYLDHINGRSHLRKIGQTTKVVKSTLNDVRVKIASLRSQTAVVADSKKYDFEARIAAIKAVEAAEQQRKKDERKAKKGGGVKPVKEEQETQAEEEMRIAMGFGSFGGGVRA